ncbi:HAMP domain-containing sensor histidine kinase [uncultured Roseobacter sp.]|uniref:sensor histidine kinase n=1 Tax=uncultured Roseobacter sp. TaxID=114847 RepID=UPI00261D5FC1|nr:HAMP domain-containing sensor histidine kinase [uncultured Roseobacter sp.]
MMRALLKARIWPEDRSVFSALLWATLFSTTVLSIVLVLSLQRVADEHPRRYLAKTLFEAFVDDAIGEDEVPHELEETSIVIMTPEETLASPYADLYRDAMNDRDRIAISSFGDRYAAVSAREDVVAVLPQFGRSISTYALFLVGLVVLSVLLTVAGIFVVIRRLTLPFDVLTHGIKKVEGGDLDYQIPLDKTYGEFRTFAASFNKMVAELQRIQESRRHMLLAIPHEILTPLSRLKVRKDMVDDAQLRTQISRDITVVEELLSSILAAEKRNSGESTCDFIDLEPFAHEQIAQMTTPGVTISVQNRTDRDTAYFDGFLASVVLKNFVSNAIRYGEGKPIKVIFSTAGEDGADLKIAVRDRGIGIAEDHVKYLMEPFWRADESRGRASGGYGLGLYLCKTIANGLGGTIEIESTLGEGTEISVTIPGALCTTLEAV